MNVNAEGGLDLTPMETRSLALHAVAQQIARQDDWLQWEDYPSLGEGAFNALNEAVIEIGQQAYGLSKSFDVANDVDSAEVLEATS